MVTHEWGSRVYESVFVCSEDANKKSLAREQTMRNQRNQRNQY